MAELGKKSEIRKSVLIGFLDRLLEFLKKHLLPRGIVIRLRIRRHISAESKRRAERQTAKEREGKTRKLRAASKR